MRRFNRMLVGASFCNGTVSVSLHQGHLNQWAHWARAQGPRIFFLFEGPPTDTACGEINFFKLIILLLMLLHDRRNTSSAYLVNLHTAVHGYCRPTGSVLLSLVYCVLEIRQILSSEGPRSAGGAQGPNAGKDGTGLPPFLCCSRLQHAASLLLCARRVGDIDWCTAGAAAARCHNTACRDRQRRANSGSAVPCLLQSFRGKYPYF